MDVFIEIFNFNYTLFEKIIIAISLHVGIIFRLSALKNYILGQVVILSDFNIIKLMENFIPQTFFFLREAHVLSL